MIITLNAEKDTYITNMKSSFANASKSNVGHAATLDLFKLHNENKNAFSWAVLEFTDVIDDAQTLQIIDCNGNTKVLEFDDNNNLTNNAHVQVDISNEVDNSNYANIISTLVNADEDFFVSAHVNSNNQLVLKQKKAGSSGDTLITLPDNATSKISEVIEVNGENKTFGRFARIDFSAAIIKFDLQDFKDNFLENVVFNDSAFNDLKAELVLTDVTTGHTKPKNYKIKAYSMQKNFEEGTGRDTINFSDVDYANFENLSESTQWQISEYISLNDDVLKITNDDNEEYSEVVLGNENLSFNVTDYVKGKINILPDAVVDDKGFLIHFDEDYLFDKKTYFVKRLGSRHLINKTFVPKLKIKIPDHLYYIPTRTFIKERFLNSAEDFFLYNTINGKLEEFVLPNDDNDDVTATSIKLKIISKDKSTVLVDDISSVNVKNYKGNVISGIKKASITNTQLSLYDENISNLLVNNVLECYLSWYSEETIDGVDIKHTILEEKIKFIKSESIRDNTFKNLKSTLKIENNDFYSDNNITKCNIYFIDTRASHDPVKLPFDLPSENLGKVQYQIINNDSNKVIDDFEENTTAYFDGEKYVFNVCFPASYKNFNLRFNFKVFDEISNNSKIIYNKTVFKVK